MLVQPVVLPGAPPSPQPAHDPAAWPHMPNHAGRPLPPPQPDREPGQARRIGHCRGISDHIRDPPARQRSRTVVAVA